MLERLVAYITAFLMVIPAILKSLLILRIRGRLSSLVPLGGMLLRGYILDYVMPCYFLEMHNFYIL